MPPRQAVVNEFEAYRPAIVSGAIVAYHDLREGRPIDVDASRVNIMLPVHLGDASPEALREAQVAEAKVNVAVRALARLADLRDRSEQGGFSGIMSRVELGF